MNDKEKLEAIRKRIEDGTPAMINLSYTLRKDIKKILDSTI